MKNKERLKSETNPTIYNRLKRYNLKCSICPPNGGENTKRKGKHGKTKPKYKNKRK